MPVLPVDQAVALVRAQLGPHLLDPKRAKVRPADAAATWGCCYVAAEAVYHLTGGKAGPLSPKSVRVPDDVHWYLHTAFSGEVVDPTADQFAEAPDYAAGVRRGFLTLQPSKRAQRVIDAVLSSLA
jgi:hypothetical protein